MQIGKDFGIPVRVTDMTSFYAARGLTSTKYRENPSVRVEFDRETRKMINPFDVNVVNLAGYMSAVTGAIFELF